VTPDIEPTGPVMSAATDVLCAGIIVADHVSSPIAHLPAAGDLVLADQLLLTIGGCAANVAVDLVKLGVNAAVVGRVGGDVFGHFQEAIAPAAKALEMSEHPECQYAWGVADGLHLLGVAHARLGDKTKAHGYLERTVEKRQPLEHPGLKDSKKELQRLRAKKAK
jgi:hypothetical protein